MEDTKNNKELILRLGLFEQQINQLQQQLQSIEQAIVDLSTIHFNLDELDGSNGREVLSLVGKGIFIKTKIISEELIVDIGGKHFVKKSIPETKKLLDSQLIKLDSIKNQLESELERVGEELTKFYNKSYS